MKFRLLLNLCLLLAIATLAIVALRHQEQSVAQLRLVLGAMDTFEAAILFIALSSLAALVLFPASLLMLFCGAYFGLWWGMAINTLGFCGGTILAFLASRHLVRDLVTTLMPGWAFEAMEKLGTNGWQSVAVLRTIGIVPGVLVNYALGVTPVSFMTYTWASAIFSLPSVFIFTYAGVAGEEFIRNGELSKLLLALSLLAATAITTSLLRKRFAKSS